MEKTKATIDFYSEIKQDDVTLTLDVRYETANTGGGDLDEAEYLQVQFLKHDVTISDERFDYNVAKEFFNNFDNYAEEIRTQIESEINN